MRANSQQDSRIRSRVLLELRVDDSRAARRHRSEPSIIEIGRDPLNNHHHGPASVRACLVMLCWIYPRDHRWKCVMMEVYDDGASRGCSSKSKKCACIISTNRGCITFGCEPLTPPSTHKGIIHIFSFFQNFASRIETIERGDSLHAALDRKQAELS